MRLRKRHSEGGPYAKASAKKSRDTGKSQEKRKHDISIAEELQAFDRDKFEASQVHAEDEDDELIKYLEKKLSIRSSKDSDAIFRSVAEEEFGGDTELFDLVKNVLKEDEADEKIEREPPLSASEDESDESMSHDSSSTMADPEVEEEDVELTERSATQSSQTSETAADGHSENKQTPAAVWRPKLFQAQKNEASKSDIAERYRQIIVRGFNRVGEGNLQITGDSMVQELQTIKDEVQLKLIGSDLAETEVNLLIDKISIACAEEATLSINSKAALALLGPQAGLICILGSRFSPKVLFRYIFMIVNSLTEALHNHDPEKDSASSLKEMARHCVHSLSLLAYFDCLDIDFLVDVCRMIGLSGENAESQTFRLELLALIFRICSVDLKRNYEPQFTELEAIIQGVISKSENSDSSEQKSSSMHVEWIRHELANVGKHRKAPMYEKLKALKTVLGKYPKTMFQILEPSLFMKAILEKNFDKAFKALRSGQRETATDLNEGVEGLKDAQEDRQLRQLAKKASIRAPLQQDVFIALAKSTDTLDATTNVLRCVKSPHNIEAALAVILHCMLQERTYNPFYAAVTNGLCSLPDPVWRKKFIKGTRRGLHLLASNDDLFVGEKGINKKAKLKLYINQISESLGDKDSAQLLAKNIFKH